MSISLVTRLFSTLTFAGEYTAGERWHVIRDGDEQGRDVLELAWYLSHNDTLNIRFKAYGCVEIYAAAELLCRHVNALSKHELAQIKVQEILAPLELPNVKCHISHQVERLWLQLINELELKNA